jgi:SAM-dependent methyltransferase
VPGERLGSAGVAAWRALGTLPVGLVRRGVPLATRIATATPDPLLARERYRSLARSYDVRTAAGKPYRYATVQRLAARPGELIIDVGCGTGLNFAQLQAVIGPRGRLIGIDPCPQMLAEARARVERHGWANVELIEGRAEDAELPTGSADAALFCGVHDVMRSRIAIENVLRHLRDDGRVVAGGPKWGPWWRPDGVALNLSTWSANRDYITTFEGFERPWGHLAELIGDLEVEAVYGGGGYIATGTWRNSPPSRRPNS